MLVASLHLSTVGWFASRRRKLILFATMPWVVTIAATDQRA
jgi:hypothetical protein